MSKWKVINKKTYYLHSIEYVDKFTSLVHLSPRKFIEPELHIYCDNIYDCDNVDWNEVIVKSFRKKLSKKWIKRMKKLNPNDYHMFSNELNKLKLKIKGI